ncbi:hypothetical protein [Mycolicibacterium madagascariense]|uniref:hypothetical protein n=1 Tax=Mycolicibacterium madagascariense TaxID=212765 RepID=UPI0013D7F57B|nr:hypothetical protein [Mycolicibacterium madagascariense]MCV7013250.1 hypothetical protein [Mycolicibacterium madagascariense]
MRHLRFAAAALSAGVLVLAPVAVVVAGPARADCTSAGDFGAGSGCPPPGDTSGGGSGESWPPTSVDWPPSQDSSDSSSSGDKSTPIVLPDGQTAPTRPAHPADTSSASGGTSSSSSTSTSASPTPIVPVGAVATAAPSTVIVAPGG